MPIAFNHGVVEPGSPLPIEAADMIAICGFLGCDLRPFNPLIAALPRVLHLPAERTSGWAARRYLDNLPEDPTGWLAGLRDRFVGKALERMHEHPDRAWTVDDLAREVGLSRSALHERFMQYLGDPPMHYLASWRIQLGSRLLRESNRTVATVAQEVGYESEAAFSRAFKRMVGMPPAAWKKAQASGQTVGSP